MKTKGNPDHANDNWFVLVPAILILVMLLRFPLPGRMADWVITQLESR